MEVDVNLYLWFYISTMKTEYDMTCVEMSKYTDKQ